MPQFLAVAKPGSPSEPLERGGKRKRGGEGKGERRRGRERTYKKHGKSL